MWKNLSNFRDGALLFLRVALGGFFIYAHGWPQLAGGLAKWKVTGLAMRHLGISFWPGYWGFMAAFAESVGVGLLMLGLFFRPSALLLAVTLGVAALSEYRAHGLDTAAHALELALVFTALIFIGPGKYSLDKG